MYRQGFLYYIMNLSYWEYKTWLSNIDYTIVGSGIVGLNCALALREEHPHAKIVVLEKGVLPQGASTKNAGFACFGSISEILPKHANPAFLVLAPCGKTPFSKTKILA